MVLLMPGHLLVVEILTSNLPEVCRTSIICLRAHDSSTVDHLTPKCCPPFRDPAAPHSTPIDDSPLQRFQRQSAMCLSGLYGKKSLPKNIPTDDRDSFHVKNGISICDRKSSNTSQNSQRKMGTGTATGFVCRLRRVCRRGRRLADGLGSCRDAREKSRTRTSRSRRRQRGRQKQKQKQKRTWR
jgi:hypothetical protein